MTVAFEYLKVTNLIKEEVEAALECEKLLYTLRF